MLPLSPRYASSEDRRQYSAARYSFSFSIIPRNGIGCWHPTFPARSDDVWLAAATAVKAIENYIITKSEKTLSIVYEQRENDGIFEGYILVDKKEDG